MRVDRSGDNVVRRCGKAISQTSQPADRALPALPDIALFSFVGKITCHILNSFLNV